MKFKKQYIIGAVITVGLLASLGGMAFAEAASTATDSTAPHNRANRAGMAQGKGMAGFEAKGMGGPNGFFGGLISAAIGKDGAADKQPGEKPDQANGIDTMTANLVAQGIISSETADKMTAYAKEQKDAMTAEMEKIKGMTNEERKAYIDGKKADGTSKAGPFGMKGNGGNMLSAMVEKGILTQSEADAITAYQKDQMAANQAARQEQQQTERKQALSDELAVLVSKNLLTQDKADAILAYYTTEQAALLSDRQAQMEKIKGMTAEERKAYLESQKTAKADSTKLAPGAALVEKGILTQDEVNNILSYYKAQFGAKAQDKIANELTTLVSDGTITSDQLSKITAALSGQGKTAITKGEKPVARVERANPLQSLLDDGTLTQAQANSVTKALFGQGKGPGRGIHTAPKALVTE